MPAKVIDQFIGEYRWLSNFWPSDVRYGGVRYPTVEHAYQAAKTTDPVQQRIIHRCASSGLAKIAGRNVSLRIDWDVVKLQVMEELVRQKFTTILYLRHRLIDTGIATIVEGNNHGDSYWGVYNGKGENHLGKILMKIRDELVAENAKG